MITFDAKQVQTFTGAIDVRLEGCAGGEGIMCEGIDKVLSCHAAECRKLVEAVRKWARDVFAGNVAYDRTTELLWQAECQRFYRFFVNMLPLGKQAEEDCFHLDGQQRLQSALFMLGRLNDNWVTPKLAVGPGARQRISLEGMSSEQVRKRMAGIPRLPADWRPTDPHIGTLISAIRKPDEA